MRKELTVYSGGGFFDLPHHILNSIIYILKKPEGVSGFNLRIRKTNGDTFTDNQLAVLKYKNVTAFLLCNHNDPFDFPRRRFNFASIKGRKEIQQLESGKFTQNLN